MAHPLIEALTELGQLEWWRGSPFGTPDSSATAPVIVARFKSVAPELVERIKEAVDCFNGNVPWSMMLPTPPRRNYVIAPRRLLNPLAGNEVRGTWDLQRDLTNSEPSFGEAANRDVLALSARIRELKNTKEEADLKPAGL
jgi:hypothetical protein